MFIINKEDSFRVPDLPNPSKVVDKNDKRGVSSNPHFTENNCLEFDPKRNFFACCYGSYSMSNMPQNCGEKGNRKSYLSFNLSYYIDKRGTIKEVTNAWTRLFDKNNQKVDNMYFVSVLDSETFMPIINEDGTYKGTWKKNDEILREVDNYLERTSKQKKAQSKILEKEKQNDLSDFTQKFEETNVAGEEVKSESDAKSISVLEKEIELERIKLEEEKLQFEREKVRCSLVERILEKIQ